MQTASYLAANERVAFDVAANELARRSLVGLPGFQGGHSMRTRTSWSARAATLFVVTFVAAAIASAQTTTGTISGHVGDSQGLALPGVTVTVSSPRLQGGRTVVTSAN